MTFGFSGKRVIVTGGSRGIGRAVALAFADAGASVSTCARGADGVARIRQEISRGGSPGHAVVCDVGEAAAVGRYIAEAADALGGIDVLVNNASGFGQRNDEAGWAASVSIDLLAAVRASDAATGFLKQSAGGSIINISSISGLRSSPRSPPYGAVKAALIHFTMSQAALLAPDRIRVNCVAPGAIEFPGGVWDTRRQTEPALYQRVVSGIPFGRMGRPEHVANTVLFLASDDAAWITGQTIVVDGGQLIGQ